MSWRISADFREMFVELVATNGEEAFFCQTANRKDVLISGFNEALRIFPEGLAQDLNRDSAELMFTSDHERISLREHWINPAALLTTEGFENLLEIGTQTRLTLFGMHPEKSKPLLPQEVCFGVTERTSLDGSVEVSLDSKEIDFVVSKLQASDIKSVAICFLHSNKNPLHEKQLSENLVSLGFKVFCSYAFEGNELERAKRAIALALTWQGKDQFLDELEKLGFKKQNIKLKELTNDRAAGIHLTLLEDRTLISCPGPKGFTHELKFSGLSTFGIDEKGLVHVGPGHIESEPGPVSFGKGLILCLIDALVVSRGLKFDDISRMKTDSARVLRQVTPLAKRLHLAPEVTCSRFVDLAIQVIVSEIRPFATLAGINLTDTSLFLDGLLAPVLGPAISTALNIKQVLISKQPQWSRALELFKDFPFSSNFHLKGKISHD